MISVCAASTEETSTGLPCGWKKQSTTDLPPSAGRLSGRQALPKTSRISASTSALRASRLSILLITTSRASPRAFANSIMRCVMASTPFTALTTITAVSTASRADSVRPRKSGYPGVSMMLMRRPCRSKPQIAASRECSSDFSCGSKSQTVVPRASEPFDRIAPDCASRASASSVLPAPACPTRARLRISAVVWGMVRLRIRTASRKAYPPLWH